MYKLRIITAMVWSYFTYKSLYFILTFSQYCGKAHYQEPDTNQILLSYKAVTKVYVYKYFLKFSSKHLLVIFKDIDKHTCLT